MTLKVLGSSSHGNCYILETEKEALILEAGVKFSDLKQGMDYNISKIAGCLITHEHKDHSEYINGFLKAMIPVYASYGTIKNTRIKGSRLPFICEAGNPFKLGDFRIIPFATKHDAAEPLGFYINHHEAGNVLFATDTYYLPYTFAGLNNILIECNYRGDLLEENFLSGRIPNVVRNRTIQSHLSYENCFKALQANDISAVNNIVLLHLSDWNSNAEEFKSDIKNATRKNVHIADKGLVIDFNKRPF